MAQWPLAYATHHIGVTTAWCIAPWVAGWRDGWAGCCLFVWEFAESPGFARGALIGSFGALGVAGLVWLPTAFGSP